MIYDLLIVFSSPPIGNKQHCPLHGLQEWFASAEPRLSPQLEIYFFIPLYTSTNDFLKFHMV